MMTALTRYRMISRIIIGVILLLLLASCADNSAEQTLEANHAAFGTQVADLRVTNTMQAARLQITVDFSSTQAAFAATQSDFLKATLSDQGTPDAYLNEFRDRMLNIQTATPTPPIMLEPTRPAARDNTSASTGMTATPVDRPLGITPLAAFATETPTVTPLPDLNGTQLVDPQLGTAVGNDDCVSEPQTAFTTQTSEIYISVEVRNAPPDTQFISRWNLRGEEVARFDYTPDFAIDGRCIWFFIDETDVDLVPGNWSVGLDVNGVAATDPLEFTITEPES